MKRWAQAVIGFLLVLAAIDVRAAEVIREFHSTIRVATDGTLEVTERIRVVAEGRQIQRGIFRDFPNLYRDANGLRRVVRFTVLAVERDGRDETWRTERRDNGVRVYIGSPERLLAHGEHTYRLTYRTDRQLGFFEDHDELYWNVTGLDWSFPIERAVAEVRLPPLAQAPRHEAYTGPKGARGRDYTATASESAPQAVFTTTRSLAPGEGLTIVVGWPPGIVARPTAADRFRDLLRMNLAALLGAGSLLIALAYYLHAWNRVGRDPDAGTIIPRYEPPKGMSPAAVRYLRRMGFDQKCLAAAILGLAVKRHLKIVEIGKTTGVFRTDDGVTRTPDEDALHEELFRGAEQVWFRNTEHERLAQARFRLEDSLERHIGTSCFSRNTGHLLFGIPLAAIPLLVAVLQVRSDADFLPLAGVPVIVIALVLGALAVSRYRAGKRVKALLFAVACTFFAVQAAVVVSSVASFVEIWPTIFGVAGIALVIVFHRLLRAPTPDGQRMLDEIEGFRRYLTVAEKDRLNLETPPDRTPELFDRFLPYALALNVEQQWAAQFADTLQVDPEGSAGTGPGLRYQPAWYSGSAFSADRFAVAGFTSSLGHSLSGAIASASTAPGQSSGFSGGGGSGGGGGGGSSGGGGGGGGGGGW